MKSVPLGGMMLPAVRIYGVIFNKEIDGNSLILVPYRRACRIICFDRSGWLVTRERMQSGALKLCLLTQANTHRRREHISLSLVACSAQRVGERTNERTPELHTHRDERIRELALFSQNVFAACCVRISHCQEKREIFARTLRYPIAYSLSLSLVARLIDECSDGQSNECCSLATN